MLEKLSYKYGEERGGFYRDGPVKLKGTNIDVPDSYMIPQIIDNISWRILDILKRDAKNPMLNSEYLNQINSCICDLIKLQPFTDGNKRTSRLLSNILYQEKGLPYVLLPTSKWDEYVTAWSSTNMDKYNAMMYNLIIESYNYFYGDQSVISAATNHSNKEIILNNRKKNM